jgi:thiopeptide-type bacteriocin biosynthesis protein
MDVKNRAALVTFDFFVVRRPSFPVSLFFDFNDACAHENSTFTNSLKNLLINCNGFLDALYIASPVLYERTKSWLEGDAVSEEAKLAKTLYKYLGRICSRGTPYGLFSGVAMGSWSEHTQFVSDKRNDKIHAELDILLLNQILDAILESHSLKEKSLYYSNNSIYPIADDLRYVEYVTQDSTRSYFLSSIKNTELLQSALSLAKNGCYLSNLREDLLSKGVSEDDAVQFVSDLIELQLLVSDFHPRVTDSNGLTALIRKIQKTESSLPFLDTLIEISSLLESGRNLTIVSQEVKSMIRQHFAEIHGGNLLHVTLQQNYKSACIRKSARKILESELTQLLPLLGSKSSPDLSTFKKEFRNKYGDAEVPLSIALDGESGIDYGSSSRLASIPILNNLHFVPAGKHSKDFTEWDAFLLEIYLRYATQGDEEIILDGADFKSFSDLPSVNPSFYAYGNLINDEEQDFKFHLSFIGGSSATTMLARFSGSDEALKEQLQEIAEHESTCYPDCLLAEIIFLPESRTANVLSHPPLYPFEIPYLTLSSLPFANQLSLDDLMVAVSRDDKLILRSKKYNKRVIPRLSNAHNYSSELPVYRFLCDIQSENNPVHFSWKWSMLEDRPVLPRVTFRHIILSRKTWNITKVNATVLDQFISQHQVPRYVQLIQGDNELLLDLNLPVARSILAEEIEKKGQAELKEFISFPSKCIIQDQEGAYTNEIVIPFKSDVQFPVPKKAAALPSGIQRKFVFGDEWAFIEVYAGVALLDKILIDIVKPFTEVLVQENLIQKWFFIRYQNPFPHIRLRFHCAESAANSMKIVNRLKEKLAMHLEQKLIDKIVLDTYDRELERYGADNIEVAETLFFLDSNLVLNLLDLITKYNTDEDRWLFACKGIASILSSFALSLDDKTDLMRNLADNFFREYADENKIEIQLNEKFRALRSRIIAVLDTNEDYAEGHIDRLFQTYTSTLKNTLTNTVHSFSEDQIGSFLHMFCNRLFLAEPREQELLAYHFLHKYYKEKRARLGAVKR